MLNTNNKIFTSESVSEGHPDKIADQISDAILDANLEADPNARVACETLVTQNLVILSGELKSNAKNKLDFKKIIKNTVREIGYDDIKKGFDFKSLSVIDLMQNQSENISQAVEESNNKNLGAGDQGIIFGYACDETDVFLPAPYVFANEILKKSATLRKNKDIKWLSPDAKSQVTVEYDEKNNVRRIVKIVLSHQHSEDVEYEEIVRTLKEKVIYPLFREKGLLDSQTECFINPSGIFVIGGPTGDTGLTGRKIIVDSYGSFARSGGGAFSGKDPSKVDRSAAYMTRYIAKNLVASGVARKLEIQVSYAIGRAEPISIKVDSYNTAKVREEEILKYIIRNFDLSPKAIIEKLKLTRPIYKKTTNYGHFGKEDLEWEKLDLVKKIQEELL